MCDNNEPLEISCKCNNSKYEVHVAQRHNWKTKWKLFSLFMVLILECLVLNCDLSWNPQVEYITRKANRVLG